MVVARGILREYEPRDLPSEHIPTRHAAALEKYGHLLNG